MAAIVGVAGVLVAAFIKGAVGFGFPALATPLLALFMDVKMAVANGFGVAFRVDPAWERVLSAPFGLLAGVVGGITNVPGTPLVLYFYALGMDKVEFVRSIAVSFVVYKLAQLVAVTQAGLMSVQRFGFSLAATGVALGAFWLGLCVQDAMNQKNFNRAVLAFLIGLGAFLVYRALA